MRITACIGALYKKYYTTASMPAFSSLEGPSGGRKALVLSLLGLGLFLALKAVMLSSFVRRDTRPPSWDQAVHLEIALDYRNAAGLGRWSDIFHLAPKPGMPPFPPLYHLALMRAYDSPDP